jgi:hypothetical protein
MALPNLIEMYVNTPRLRLVGRVPRSDPWKVGFRHLLRQIRVRPACRLPRSVRKRWTRHLNDTLIVQLLHPRPWRPNYRSLLPFKQLRELEIEFSCEDGCSSTMDDDIITDMARAMPRLETLQLGENRAEPPPVSQPRDSQPWLVIAQIYPPSTSTFEWIASMPHQRLLGLLTLGPQPGRDCALTDLDVGKTPMLEESALMAALTLVRIFPNIMQIDYTDENWGKVSDSIYLSGQIVDCSSKERPLSTPRCNLSDTFPGATFEGGS